MRRLTLRVLVLGLTFLAAAPAFAQQQSNGPPLPRLDGIFPLGAKVGGGAAELNLLGTDLEDTELLIFSHVGIKADPIPAPTPKIDPKDPKKQPMAAPKGPSKFKVTVAADVPVGIYDVRAVNKWGVSNPRAFVVGDLAETNEKEPNNDVPEAQKVEINTTINGVIAAATDVDYSVFTGKKGQRILLSCLSTSIDSRLIPSIEVFDVAGKPLASNSNYHFNDALADVVLPADGEYFVRLSQVAYVVGGPQYFYRLSITAAPWIDAVFPPMVEAGKPSQVTLYGRNLPGGTPEAGMQIDGKAVEKLVVTINPPVDPLTTQRLIFPGRIDPKSAALDGFEYHVKGPNGSSNSVLIALASAKVYVEHEGNDKPETAEAIPVPCEVAGRIDKRYDRDWYSFEAKKGEIFSIELWSDRLGGQSDFVLSLRAGKATSDITEQDDNPEILNNVQFYTRTNDPSPYRFAAPEDGKYLIQVTSREANFLYGPRVAYRLRVAPEKPDFRLVVMASGSHIPDTTVLRADGNQYFDVFVFRSDGFTGPIALTAEGLPPGVTCAPQSIGNGQKQGLLVLSAAPNAANGQKTISVQGTATIQGQPVVREARSATITWATAQGQNVPTIARLDQGLFLCIRDKAPFNVTLEPEKAFVKKEEKLQLPLILKQGDKLTVPFKVNRIAPDAKQPITLQQIITAQNVQTSPVTVGNGQPLPPVAPDKSDGTFVIDVKTNALPGTYTIALKASMPIPFVKDPMTKKSQNVTYVQSSTPITIRVIPTSVGKITASGPAGNLKPGMSGEITIKVVRENGYTGEFKVKVAFPTGSKGVTAEEATIPAGKDEAKVTLKAAVDAPAGPINNLIVQAVALVEGKIALTSETKLNVTVEKAAPPKK